MSRGGAERERETQNQKQAPGSELSAQSMMGLKKKEVPPEWKAWDRGENNSRKGRRLL